jgi:hypothetical protein
MLIYCINFKEKNQNINGPINHFFFFFNSMDANQHDKDRRDFRAMAMTLSLIFSNLLFVLMNKIDRLSNFGQRKEMRVPSLAN